MNEKFWSEISDENLNNYLNGTACEIGSKANLIALQEKERRDMLKDKNEREKQFDRLIKALEKLAENWASKLFWLLLIASISGIIINVVSAIILSHLGIVKG